MWKSLEVDNKSIKTDFEKEGKDKVGSANEKKQRQIAKSWNSGLDHH